MATLSADVVSVAVPLLDAMGAPRLVFPSLNCTVPVTFAGVTEAVKVTACPRVEGLLLELIVVVLPVNVTACTLI